MINPSEASSTAAVRAGTRWWRRNTLHEKLFQGHSSNTGCLAELVFVVRRARARQSAPGASADQFLHFRARLLGLCCTKQTGRSWDEV
ncbi:hypothetical protein T07_3077 [Trichinella nelsoni]|uniref:Uncharacterized protein n=1 Tax=Trichinella nelsoni TaxID=6336 RepID=A0A0V0S6H5_9BILA|nr:hypothetical protein T07_3077 [Trichinella nelsoni]